MTEKILRLGGAFSETARIMTAMPGAFTKAWSLVLVLYLVDALDLPVLKEDGPAALWVFQALLFLVHTLAMVTSCRLFLIGERQASWLRLGMAELRFFGWIILILVVAALIILVTATPLLMVKAGSIPQSGIGFLLVWVLVAMPGMFVYSQLALVLPRIAVTGGSGEDSVWALAEGNRWPVFVLAGLIPMLGAAIFGLAEALPVLLRLPLQVLYVALLAFETGLLSHCYRLIASDNAGQADELPA